MEAVAPPDHLLAQRIDHATHLTPRQKNLTLVGVLLGLFLAALDQTVVATATPRILQDLQGMDLLAWISTSYLLASTAMVPIYGKLSDLFGRKVILLFGIAVFLASSALCGTASTMEHLVLYRALQGLGSAALTSTAFAVPADLFPPAERARYQGLFGAVFGLASVLGPFVGGLLTDGPGWRWVFFVNLPLGALASVFIITQMPRLHSGLKAQVDYLGAALLLLTVVPLLLALTLDKTLHPWNSAEILGLFGVAALGLAVLLPVEARAREPIMALSLFVNPVYALICGASMFVGASFFAVVLFLSLFMVNVVGVSATQAGTALMPMTLAMVVGNVVSGAVVQRLGRYKAPVLLGMVLQGLGLALLSQMDLNTTLWGVRGCMVLIGLGLGPAMPLLNLALQNAVPFERVGAATASRQFFQQVGATAGAAVFGALLTSTLTAGLETRLAPLKGNLPPQVVAQLDVGALRNGRSLGGAGSSAVGGLAARLEAAVRAPFEARKMALKQDSAALSNLAADEAAAVEKGNLTAHAVETAIREAFAASVTGIYAYSVPLVVMAFILIALMKELPLRKSNRATPPSHASPDAAAAQV